MSFRNLTPVIGYTTDCKNREIAELALFRARMFSI